MDVWETGDGIIEFPDGRRLRGRGLRQSLRDCPAPEFGVYLTGRDPNIEGWPYRWVRWRDFRLPDSTADAVAALREAHQHAASERVEIACGGGVGRTGTALVVLAVLSGVDVNDAVAWVREHYHPRGIETRRQRFWANEVATMISF